MALTEASGIRVCIVTPFPPAFAGGGMRMSRYLPLLEARGIRPIVLTFQADPESAGTAWNHRVARVIEPPAGRPLVLLRSARQIFRYLHDHQSEYDIVHSLYGGLPFLANIPRLRALGKPVIYEMTLLGPHGPPELSWRSLWLGSRLLARTDRLITVSGSFLPWLRASSLGHLPCDVIHTGVDTDRFRPVERHQRLELRTRLGFPADARIVVCVGAVTRRKGIGRLLRAWHRVRPRPSHDLLVVVGPSSEHPVHHTVSYGSKMQRFAAARGIADTVRFEGRVANVHEYLAAADLFVLLSRAEGLPNALVEAMASGLACAVAPFGGSAAEIVADGRSGVILANPEDAAGVGEEISRLLSDAELRHDMGQVGRRIVLERFELHRPVEVLAHLYREVFDAARVGGLRRPVESTVA